jgi:syntaxin 5
VREVEKTIVELGSLFQRLTGMIHEQQDMVERIDEDVEAARGDAEAGGDQLNTAYENASSGKTFAWKLGGIATVFTVFFTVFLL